MLRFNYYQMSDLQNRNAEAMKTTLREYTIAAEALIKRVDKQQETLTMLMNRVANVEQQIAMLRIQRMGTGPTE